MRSRKINIIIDTIKKVSKEINILDSKSADLVCPFLVFALIPKRNTNTARIAPIIIDANINQKKTTTILLDAESDRTIIE